MSDLISRQAAIAILDRWLLVKGYSEGEINVMRCMRYELEDMPSADVVEVVRCKDCVYSHETFNGLLCAKVPNHFIYVYDDDFCSYGERKDG